MNNPIDKLAWICLKDKKILSVRSYGKDTYYTPGGKREGNETDQEALIREIKEELSVDLVPTTIKYMASFEAQAHGKPAGVMVRLTCYTADFIGELKPAAEIKEIAWHTHKHRDKTSLAGQMVFDDLFAKGLLA